MLDSPVVGVPPAPDFANLMRDAAVRGPSFALFTPEDALEIDCLNSVAGVVVTVSGELLGQRLELMPFSFSFTPTSNRVVSTVRQAIGSGWLQQVRVVVSSGAPLRGQTFAWIRKARGTTSNALVTGTFQSGYFTATTDLFWPGPFGGGPLDGDGAIRVITAAVPAAGAEVVETVPTGARWELLSFTTLFTTSAAVANRGPTLIIDDGANILYRWGNTAFQTASGAFRRTWAPMPFVAGSDGANDFLGATPIGFKLLAGFRLRTLTVAIDVADTYTLTFYVVREWFEGN
jgi:hypothetical protein